MNKYIIFIIFIIAIYLLLSENTEKFYVPENKYIYDYENKNIDKIIDTNINIDRNDILCIPQYQNKNTIKLLFLNFTNEYININLYFNNIKKIFKVIPSYSEYIIYDENFNFQFKKDKNINIPKTIMQTSKSRYVTNNKFLSVRSIIDHNPHYNYVFYDNEEAKSFIVQYYDKDVIDAYNKLIPGAYKADLFRYCYLYIKGGIYIDCKMICHINFDELFTYNYDIILVKDRISNAYWNGFICAKPKLEIFRKCINEVVENVKKEYYGSNMLDITGPTMFYNTIHSSLNNLNTKILYLTNLDYQDLNNHIYDENNKKILNVLYPNYYIENDYRLKNHYHVHWNNKTVYKKDIL
jgi:mannosyltransferase OCH1-like enzyme